MAAIYLTAEYFAGKIDAFCRIACRYDLSADIVTMSELFGNAARDLFNKLWWRWHCLDIVLLEEKNSSQTLHARGHHFHLLRCAFFRRSFVSRCLYRFSVAFSMFIAFRVLHLRLFYAIKALLTFRASESSVC